MKVTAWMQLYNEISIDFGFDPKKDYVSSAILSNIIRCNSYGALNLSRFKNKKAFVIGNGPDLRKNLKNISPDFTIVADSAIDTFCDEIGCPDIIVTDLDGNIQKIKECSRKGTIIAVHAHGDNIPAIRRHASYFLPNMIGTTQHSPLYNVYNFGGFTDGDRAAFLADYLKSPEITLVSFDFENPSYKTQSQPSRKLKKLKWAKHLLEILSAERGSTIKFGSLIYI